MSANFILEYAGAPVRFTGDTGDTSELVAVCLASRFTAEHEAWYAAWRAGLVPGRCRVVNLYERESRSRGWQGEESHIRPTKPEQN